MSLKSIKSNYIKFLQVLKDNGMKINESQKEVLDNFMGSIESTISQTRDDAIRTTKRLVEEKMENEYKMVFESILKNKQEHQDLSEKIQTLVRESKEQEPLVEAVDAYLEKYVEQILPKKSIVDYERLEKLEKIQESLKDLLQTKEIVTKEKTEQKKEDEKNPAEDEGEGEKKVEKKPAEDLNEETKAPETEEVKPSEVKQEEKGKNSITESSKNTISRFQRILGAENVDNSVLNNGKNVKFQIDKDNTNNLVAFFNMMGINTDLYFNKDCKLNDTGDDIAEKLGFGGLNIQWIYNQDGTSSLRFYGQNVKKGMNEFINLYQNKMGNREDLQEESSSNQKTVDQELEEVLEQKDFEGEGEGETEPSQETLEEDEGEKNLEEAMMAILEGEKAASDKEIRSKDVDGTELNAQQVTEEYDEDEPRSVQITESVMQQWIDTINRTTPQK